MEKESFSNSRLRYVDAAKGVAMILVVMGHVLYFSVSRESDYAWKLASLQEIAHYHMPLFVFISGLMTKTIDMPPEQVTGTFCSKSLKLIAPCLFFGLFYSIIFQKGVVHFFLDGMKHGYWYLWVLAEYYLFSLFFARFCKHPHWKLIGELLFGGVVFVFLGTMNRYLLPDLSGFFSLHNCVSYFPCFFGGLLIRRYQLLEKIVTVSYCRLIIVFLSIIGFLVPTLPLAKYWNLAAVIILVLQILYFWERRDLKIIRYLASIGRSSLDIYLLHYFIVFPLSLIFLQSYMLIFGWGAMIQVLVSFAIAVPISVLCMFIGTLIHKSQLVETYIFCKAKKE